MEKLPSSIQFLYLLNPFQSHRGTGAYPSGHQVKSGAHLDGSPVYHRGRKVQKV